MQQMTTKESNRTIDMYSNHVASAPQIHSFKLTSVAATTMWLASTTWKNVCSNCSNTYEYMYMYIVHLYVHKYWPCLGLLCIYMATITMLHTTTTMPIVL